MPTEDFPVILDFKDASESIGVICDDCAAISKAAEILRGIKAIQSRHVLWRFPAVCLTGIDDAGCFELRKSSIEKHVHQAGISAVVNPSTFSDIDDLHFS